MSAKNTNKLNIPEARAAMDKFKMEAANEVDVYPPQRILPTLDFGLHTGKCLSRKSSFRGGNILLEAGVSPAWIFVTFPPQKRPLHDLCSPVLGVSRLPALLR